MILKKIKLQPKLCVSDLNADLYTINLYFGRKKSEILHFPLLFSNMEKCIELMKELEPLKGKTIDEVKEVAETLFEKYKKFNYRKPKEIIKEHAIADKWIKELKEAGLSYDDMLIVFANARRKLAQLKKVKS